MVVAAACTGVGQAETAHCPFGVPMSNQTSEGLNESASIDRPAATSYRFFIERHKAAILMMAMVTLCTALLLLATGLRPPEADNFRVPLAFYYDLNTGSIVVEPEQVFSPVFTESGKLAYNEHVVLPVGAGVKAHVFSCTSCDEFGSEYIGYLERYTAGVRTAVEQPAQYFSHNETDEQRQKIREGMAYVGRQVAAAPQDSHDRPDWLSAASEEGVTIVAEAHSNCIDGQPPVRCTPPQEVFGAGQLH
jgi:hypothetical protein